VGATRPLTNAGDWTGSWKDTLGDNVPFSRFLRKISARSCLVAMASFARCKCSSFMLQKVYEAHFEKAEVTGVSLKTNVLQH
jgi:hypothetical protein